MADKEMLTPVKLLYAYWPAEDQRILIGFGGGSPIDTAKAMIAEGKAERADPFPGEK